MQSPPERALLFAPEQLGTHPAERAQVHQPQTRANSQTATIKGDTEVLQGPNASIRPSASVYSSDLDPQGTADGEQMVLEDMDRPQSNLPQHDGLADATQDSSYDEQRLSDGQEDPAEQSKRLSETYGEYSKLISTGNPYDVPADAPSGLNRASAYSSHGTTDTDAPNLDDFPSPPSERPGSSAYRTAPQTPARDRTVSGIRSMQRVDELERVNDSNMSDARCATPDSFPRSSRRNTSAPFGQRASSAGETSPATVGSSSFSPPPRPSRSWSPGDPFEA